TDADLRELSADRFDAFVVPGGWAPDFLRRTPHAAKLIAEADVQGKLVAAICHGGWVLASARILAGKRLTSFFAIRDDLEHAGAKWEDKSVVVDGNLITSRAPDDLPDFMKAILHGLEAQR
ncbi:MAG: protease, partial [Myxococcales bacterium]